MHKKLLLIVNPVAGKMRIKGALMDVIRIFAEGDFAVTVMVTNRRGDAVEFAGAGAAYDLIVCCGGDGTLNEVISGMLTAGISIPLGYIPCGSTNDFGSSMGLSSNIKKAHMPSPTGCRDRWTSENSATGILRMSLRLALLPPRLIQRLRM